MNDRRQHVCPACHKTVIDRAPGNLLLNALLRLIGRRRYVCRSCGQRFVDRPLGRLY